MNYKNAIFDLDGTLFQTGDGIVRTLAQTFIELGYEPPSNEQLLGFVGPSLYESFITVGHFSQELALKAVTLYRDKYLDSSIFDCKMYDGVPEMLKKLSDKGVLLTIASSKPHSSLIKLLTHFNILQYFKTVSGPSFAEKSSDKTMLIKNAIADGNCIMIGDRKYDILGAQNLNLDTILVTYGYAPQNELTELAPTYKAANTKEITKIILG